MRHLPIRPIASLQIFIVLFCLFTASCSADNEIRLQNDVHANETEKTSETLPIVPGEPALPNKPDGDTPRDNKPKDTLIITGPYNGTAPPSGRWGLHRQSNGEAEPAPWQKEQLDKLQALGYVQGSQPATAKSGITQYDKKKAYNGLNFYVSGHAPAAALMDMNGKVLHEWKFPFEKALQKEIAGDDLVHTLFWRRAFLYANGDLLAVFEGLGMVKIDKNSHLIWKSPLLHHHDVKVDEKGDIFSLTRVRHIMPDINPTLPVIEDFITVLAPDGTVKKNVSLIKAMQAFPDAARFWDKSRRNKGDIFHTNTVHLLSGALSDQMPAFSKGRILTSMFFLNAVFVVDLDREKIVWGFKSDFKNQHDAQFLKNGRLLLFDNVGGNPVRGGSRALEFNFKDPEPVWSYEGTEQDKFYSRTAGTVQRLPNGNTLITETDNGRAFEVTTQGSIVWEFVNPHRAGAHNELVACLMMLNRIRPQYVSWLKGR